MVVAKRRHEIAHNSITKLSIVGFFSSLALAHISTIWALYIDSFVHDIAKVGLVTSFFAIVAFFANFLIVPLIEKNEKSKLYISSLLFFIVSYIGFALIKNFWVFMILATLLTFVGAVRLSVFGMIIKDSSRKKELSKNEGIVYTVLNTAFLIGPLSAGYIASEISLKYVFIFAAILFLGALLIFKKFSIRDANISKKIDTNLVKNFVDFFRNKDRVIAYFIYGGVQLWWSFIYGFIPLFIVRQGLGEKGVGYFLFVVVIPLLAFEYYFAKKAPRVGFTTMFKVGYAIAALLALICFFVSNIYIVLALLTLASVGLAMLEPTMEAYFFGLVKKEEEARFYSPLHTSIDVNFFIGKITASLVLFIFPFKYLFILYALFMLSLCLLSFKARKIH